MTEISGKRSFNGELLVPGDKSISHRALLLSALANGKSDINGLSEGKDVLATKSMIAQLGATVVDDGDTLWVEGGLRRLRPPSETVEVGNSGTLIRLGAGLTAGLGGRYTFSGDASVNSRPMKRIFIPLTQMGAKIEAFGSGETAPFVIDSHEIAGITYEMPVASAQVKSAILLAGLGASGITKVIETIPTRRHSEEMLADAGAGIEVIEKDGVTEISVGHSELRPLSYHIPGDPSQAAFWIVAAIIAPSSKVTVRNIYLGELRSDFIDVLVRMGADIEIDRTSKNTGNVTARSSDLRAVALSGREIAGLIDEIPILCVAAARAEGVTTIRNAEELRVKESDRISVMAAALRSFGLVIEEYPDGMDIVGGSKLQAGSVTAHLDHRVAMASAILACTVDGKTEITGFESVESSYPKFLDDLESLSGI